MKINKAQAQALLRLKTPEFQPFMAILDALEVEALAVLAGAVDIPLLHRQQGRVQVIRELKNLVANSSELAQKVAQ